MCDKVVDVLNSRRCCGVVGRRPCSLLELADERIKLCFLRHEITSFHPHSTMERAGVQWEGESDMGKYVIQRRENHWSNRWVVRSEHETLEEAKAELAKLPFQQEYRIAEAYTVVRYKPVKEVR